MWNAILSIAGFYLKQNWYDIMKYSHVVDIVVLLILALGFLFFIYQHIHRK